MQVIKSCPTLNPRGSGILMTVWVVKSESPPLLGSPLVVFLLGNRTSGRKRGIAGTGRLGSGLALPPSASASDHSYPKYRPSSLPACPSSSVGCQSTLNDLGRSFANLPTSSSIYFIHLLFGLTKLSYVIRQWFLSNCSQTKTH